MPFHDRNVGILHVCWQEHSHNAHISDCQLQFTDWVPEPGGECKQICVGCQLPSLLKDKNSIWRMCCSLTRTSPRTNSNADPPACLWSQPLPIDLYHSLLLIRTTIVPSLPKHPWPALPANLWPCVSTDLRTAVGLQTCFCTWQTSPPWASPLALSRESRLCMFDLLGFLLLTLAHTLSTLTEPEVRGILSENLHLGLKTFTSSYASSLFPFHSHISWYYKWRRWIHQSKSNLDGGGRG